MDGAELKPPTVGPNSEPILVKPGRYVVVGFGTRDVIPISYGLKLIEHFRIEDTAIAGPDDVDPEIPSLPVGLEYAEAICTDLPRYYTILSAGERIAAAPRSDYARECRIAQQAQRLRYDQMPVQAFTGKRFVAVVKTVTRRFDGSRHEPVNYYSIIERIERRIEPSILHSL